MKKAMIFAAGLGSRLGKITSDRPKALVEVGGKTLLEWNIRKLKASRYNTIVVNVHHFAEKVKTFLTENNNFGCDIIISEETDSPLETGGGLLKASSFLKSDYPILLYNVDILTDMTLEAMEAYHRNSKAMATLAIRSRDTSRKLLFNSDNELVGWKNKTTGQLKRSRPELPNEKEFAFSGVQLIEYSFIANIIERGKFSIIDPYLRLATDWVIKGFDHSYTQWLDVGKPYSLMEANQRVNANILKP